MKKATALIGILMVCTFGAPAEADRLHEGEALYLKECGICHLPGEMGSNILSRRLGKERGVLAARSDLTPGFIVDVVRHGQLMMPRFSRVEVSDPELEAITDYLTDAQRSRAKDE